MKEIIEKYDPDDFIELLPPTSQLYARSMLDSNNDLTKLAIQLSNEPGKGLAIKGGQHWPEDIGQRVIKEIHTLICTEDSEYETIREKIKGEGVTSANVLLFIISNAIAAQAGMAAALCVPLVALTLAAITKVGISAWCKSFQPPNKPRRDIDPTINPS